VTETTDLLLLVQAVGGHLHAAIRKKLGVRSWIQKHSGEERSKKA
jgi:hypothetical protein